MKKYFFAFIALLTFTAAMAQKPVITFETNNYDFGKIKEEDGKATYVFKFKNTGKAPMVVSRVQASCGCTTPEWTKEPIEPGKGGTITVTYNPLGRPGAFTKSITVYSNSSEPQVTLIIRGEVVPKETADANQQRYPVTMGDLLVSTKVVQMGSLDKGSSMTRVVAFMNNGKAPVKVSMENLPSYMTASVSPEIVKPKEEGKVIITLNSRNSNQWGPNTDDLYLTINGQKKYSEDFQVKVFSNIMEDFSKMTTEQRRKAPIVETSNRTLTIGDIKSGQKKAVQFKISNRGINPLEIRRVVNNNKEIKVGHQKMSIANGRTHTMTFTVDTSMLPEGDYRKTITIHTNDPDNSVLLLVLSWSVKR